MPKIIGDEAEEASLPELEGYDYDDSEVEEQSAFCEDLDRVFNTVLGLEDPFHAVVYLQNYFFKTPLKASAIKIKNYLEKLIGKKNMQVALGHIESMKIKYGRSFNGHTDRLKKDKLILLLIVYIFPPRAADTRKALLRLKSFRAVDFLNFYPVDDHHEAPHHIVRGLRALDKKKKKGIELDQKRIQKILEDVQKRQVKKFNDFQQLQYTAWKLREKNDIAYFNETYLANLNKPPEERNNLCGALADALHTAQLNFLDQQDLELAAEDMRLQGELGKLRKRCDPSQAITLPEVPCPTRTKPVVVKLVAPAGKAIAKPRQKIIFMEDDMEVEI